MPPAPICVLLCSSVSHFCFFNPRLSALIRVPNLFAKGAAIGTP
jgi:hypothetical protein